MNFKVLTLLAAALAANAATMIYDNGTPDVTSSSARGITAFRSADDFTLANAANVSSVRFWMVDQPGNFSGSITYAFYQNSAGALGSLISSATVSGITPLFLNQIPGNIHQIERVDFNLAAPLALATGTYWLELHDGSSLTTVANANTPNVLWAIVSGNPVGNAKQDVIPNLPTSNTGNTLAFQLFDNSTASTNAVPEPTPVSICAISLAVLAIRRRKSRKDRNAPSSEFTL